MCRCQAVELGILKHSVTESLNFCPFLSKLILHVFRFFVVYTSEGLAIEDTLYFQETFFNCTAIGRSVRGISPSLCVLNR